MTEWKPIETAPSRKVVIVWGNGGMRFLQKDDGGQWRSMMGHPKETPKFWMHLPTPPDAH